MDNQQFGELSPILVPTLPTKIDKLSVAQLYLSIFISLCLMGFSVILVISGFFQFLSSPSNLTDLQSFILGSASSLFCALLVVPSILFSYQKLFHTELMKIPSIISQINIPQTAILFLPIILIVGYWISSQPFLSLLFLPPIHILSIGLPIAWILSLGLKQIQAGSSQRSWGLFNTGLLLAPSLIFIIEIIALLFFLLFILLYIAFNPHIASEFNSILPLISSQQMEFDELVLLISPHLFRPWFITAVLVFGAAIIPMIEEFLKPVGMWFLMKRHLTPHQGFAAGVICGAGYALFESLAFSSSGNDWLLLVSARIGTGAIHIVTTGFVGWALALAWERSQFIQLGITYLLSVMIHGIWNALALLAMFATISNSSQTDNFSIIISKSTFASTFGLITLMIGSLIVLILSNRSLIKKLNTNIS